MLYSVVLDGSTCGMMGQTQWQGVACVAGAAVYTRIATYLVIRCEIVVRQPVRQIRQKYSAGHTHHVSTLPGSNTHAGMHQDMWLYWPDTSAYHTPPEPSLRMPDPSLGAMSSQNYPAAPNRSPDHPWHNP